MTREAPTDVPVTIRPRRRTPLPASSLAAESTTMKPSVPNGTTLPADALSGRVGTVNWTGAAPSAGWRQIWTLPSSGSVMTASAAPDGATAALPTGADSAAPKRDGRRGRAVGVQPTQDRAGAVAGHDRAARPDRCRNVVAARGEQRGGAERAAGSVPGAERRDVHIEAGDRDLSGGGAGDEGCETGGAGHVAGVEPRGARAGTEHERRAGRGDRDHAARPG